ARLVGVLDRVEFPAGSLIFSEGAEADALYLLEAGRVAVSVAGASNTMLTEIESPGYFGELGLLLNQRTASVQAATDLTASNRPGRRCGGVGEGGAAVEVGGGGGRAAGGAGRAGERGGAPLGVKEPRATVFQAPPVRRSSAQRLAGGGIVFPAPAALWYATPP